MELKLDYIRLFEYVESLDPRIKLIQYIYDVQGFSPRRLDFGKAAKALNVSWKTIHRYCDQLADVGILAYQGNTLQLVEELIAIN